MSSGKLKRLTGMKTRMATPEETFETTGFRPGGVCPFGVSGIPICVDASLSIHETVYPAAGTDASGVPVSYDSLIRITGASECDVTARAEPG